MLDRIVVAKIEWADYYQGEPLESTFSDGDQYERYNFRRAADGYFYGVIPGRTPKDRTPGWTLFFVARHPTERVLAVVGWYEDSELCRKTSSPRVFLRRQRADECEVWDTAKSRRVCRAGCCGFSFVSKS